MSGDDSRTRPAPLSYALVAAQFALLALLASPLEALVPATLVDLPGTALAIIAVAIALAAVFAMRARNLSVLPEPVANGTLVERGPYRLVRHPMYAAVLLGGFGAALLHRDALHWLWLALLAPVLVVKIRREERLLAARYPTYADYRRRVSALVPGLY